VFFPGPELRPLLPPPQPALKLDEVKAGKEDNGSEAGGGGGEEGGTTGQSLLLVDALRDGRPLFERANAGAEYLPASVPPFAPGRGFALSLGFALVL
jgi:hypothetical protein